MNFIFSKKDFHFMSRPKKWNKKLIIEEIHRLHKKMYRRPVKRDSSLLYQLSRKYFGSWNSLMRHSGYDVKNIQKIDVPSLSPNFCYFIGLIISDGHLAINKKRYSVKIATSYDDEKDMICFLIKKLFSYKPTIRKRKYGWNVFTNYEIIISSKNLLYFLNKTFKIPIGAKSKIVRIPKLFFKTYKENIGSFIRGIIDGDGSVSEGNQDISISSGSILFLTDMKKLLDNMSIESGKINKDKNNVFNLRMSSKSKNLKKLYSILYPSRFYYPRKKLAWDKLLKNLN
jgi:hypothetical protein